MNNNINNINGGSYVRLLLALQDVCQEANVSLTDDKNIIQSYRNNPALCAQMESLPGLPVREVTTKINEFVKGKKAKLLIFEAARRAGEDGIAAHFLNKWQQSLQKQISTKFNISEHPENVFAHFMGGHNPFFQSNQSLEDGEAKIKLITDKYKWPKFQNPKDVESIIYTNLNSLFAKEIVFQKLHEKQIPLEIPPHAVKVCGSSRLNSVEKFVVDKYAHLMKRIGIDESSRLSLSDETVIAYLNRFPNLATLDLTDCIYVTPDCLNTGHRNLGILTLTGTRIKVSDVPRAKFPSLEFINQDRVLNVFDMTALNNDISWPEIVVRAESADKILNSEQCLDRLITRWKSQPTIAGMRALILLGNNEHIRSSSFNEKMIKSFLEAWKSESIELSKEILEILLELTSSAKHQQPILQEFFKALSLHTVVNRFHNGYKENRDHDDVMQPTEKDVARIRFLMNRIVRWDWSAFHNLMSQISTQLYTSADHLFYSKTGSPASSRNPMVVAHELLHENYVTISHDQKVSEKGYIYSEFKDPNKVTRRHDTFNNDSMVFFNIFLNAATGTTYQAGPLLKEVTAQNLAALFCFNQRDRDEREKSLTNVLKNFADYVSPTHFYPLAKIILGVVEESDIPAWDQNSNMKPHLLNYKGVFNENISDELKEMFWQALIEGKIGQRTLALVEGLALFFRKEGTSEMWKEKALKALKYLGGVKEGPITGFKYSLPTSDDVTSRARELYKSFSP